MAIYNKGGNTVSSAFSKNGTPLSTAYNKNGETVFSSGSQLPDYSSYSYTQKWASKGISNTQGFAIYDGKVFWISKSGNSTVPANCYVWNLSDGTQALSTDYVTAYTGHGNSLSIDFPKMYSATAYAGGNVYISTFSNDFLMNTLDKTLALPDTSYGCDACIDDTNGSILWSIHHTAAITDLSTPWRIKKWNLNSLTDNGDGTYTPELLQDVSLAQPANSPYFQGCAMHDGILWFANGYSGSGSGAFVFGVNPNAGEYLYSIDCETTAEPEGVAWVEDEEAVGGYAMYVGFQGMALRKYTFAQEEEMHSTYRGKTLSILGDSISTYSGYIPSGNTSYYPTGTIQDVTDTWWYKLMTALEMTLNVNNSYSGSRVTTTNGDTSAGCGTRAESLGTAPDVIIIWMGINDFNNEVALGTYDGKSAVPSTTTTFREAYGNMLNKVLTAYPSAEVWCCTLPQCERNGTEEFPEINGNNVPLADFNAAITELAKSFGVKVLDHNRCGLTYQNMDVYNPDELHPNKYGHSLVANNDIRQMDNAVRTRYAIA